MLEKLYSATSPWTLPRSNHSYKAERGRSDGTPSLSNVPLIKFWKHSYRNDCSAPCHGGVTADHPPPFGKGKESREVLAEKS